MVVEPGRRHANSLERRRQAARQSGGATYESRRRDLARNVARLLHEKGYRSTTLKDMAEVNAVDRVTLYAYFSCKEEILCEAVAQAVAETADQVRVIALSSGSARERVERIIGFLVRSYHDLYPQPQVFVEEMLGQDWIMRSEWARGVRAAAREMQDHVVALLEEGVRCGEFELTVPAPLAVNAMYGMVNWMHRWYRPGREHEPEVVAAVFSAILMEGVHYSGPRTGSRRTLGGS